MERKLFMLYEGDRLVMVADETSILTHVAKTKESPHKYLYKKGDTLFVNGTNYYYRRYSDSNC